MRLYFVRHGESTWNAEGRFQGQLDPPLSDLGVRQAEAVAERFANGRSNKFDRSSIERPAAIVSSPLQRARRTAEIIGERCGVAVSVDERLTEINHGPWQGVLESDVALRWPALYKQWHESPATARFPEGESLADVQARLDAFLRDAGALPSPLVVCTHDVLIRLAVLWAKRQSAEHFFEWRNENAAITAIDVEDSRPELVQFNDVRHLDGLRSDVARQAL